MNLSDIMMTNVITVTVDDTVGAIRELFNRRQFHHLLVTDQGYLAGIISDRDLLKNISPFLGSMLGERPQDVDLLRRRAHQIMSHHPVTARPHTSIAEAAYIMLRKTISCLPVVDDVRKPMGIVTMRDLLRTIVKPDDDHEPQREISLPFAR